MEPAWDKLQLAVAYQPVDALKPNPRNARQHSKKQLRQIAASIQNFGFVNPVLVDGAGMVLAGHGRLAAAKMLSMTSVPTILIADLSDAQKRAYVLADNKLAENAGWNRDMLAAELGALAILLPEISCDLTLTGFGAGEIDAIFADQGTVKRDPDDDIPKMAPDTVSRRGELWRLGSHRLLCGDARSPADLDRLLSGAAVRMVFTDPPYNVPIVGHVQGRGKLRHREFAFASGEMSRAEFTAFLQTCLANVNRVCQDGALVFVCMDWRHMLELQTAGEAVFSELKNVIVWHKTSPGQGSFYRSQHELIFAFKVGQARHINSFGLGGNGRTRSNVWTYPGANSFHSGRKAELARHPTVKPIALVVDALRDCSLKHDIVLDVFLGSGTCLLAAERIGRRCYGLEFDPDYVDLCIRRWEGYTKLEATLDGDGRTWTEIREERLAAPPPNGASGKEAS